MTPAKASVSRMLDFEMPIREQPRWKAVIRSSRRNGVSEHGTVIRIPRAMSMLSADTPTKCNSIAFKTQ